MSSSSSDSISGSRRSIPVVSADQASQVRGNSISEGHPPPEPGDRAPAEAVEVNVVAAAKNERTTLGKVGNGILRGLAGVTGGALYGAAFTVGGGLALATGAVILTLCAPTSLIGAGIGAIIGGKKGATEGAKKGLMPGLIIGVVIDVLILGIPKMMICQTVGKLGAGLCAFAATGKGESTQLKGDRFAKRSKNGVEVRNKSTNEKLRDALILNSFIFLLIEKQRNAQLSSNVKPVPINERLKPGG